MANSKSRSFDSGVSMKTQSWLCGPVLRSYAHRFWTLYNSFQKISLTINFSSEYFSLSPAEIFRWGNLSDVR